MANQITMYLECWIIYLFGFFQKTLIHGGGGGRVLDKFTITRLLIEESLIRFWGTSAFPASLKTTAHSCVCSQQFPVGSSQCFNTNPSPEMTNSFLDVSLTVKVDYAHLELIVQNAQLVLIK